MGDSRRSLASIRRWYARPAFMFLALLATAACASDGSALTAPQAPHDAGGAAAGDTVMQAAAPEQSAPSAAPIGEVQVRIENFQFSPATLTIPAGTTVTWINDDREEHTVTSSTRAFSSAGLDTAETYAHRFDTPGTYAYFCALHPHITAQIIVQ